MKQTRVLVWIFYIVLFILMGLAAALIFPLYKQHAEDTHELAKYRKIEESKQAISNELANEVHQLQTSPEAVEKVAREKFNLCKEGETVLHYETASPEGNSGKTE